MATEERQLAYLQGATISIVLDTTAKNITGVHVVNPGPGTLTATVQINNRVVSRSFAPGSDVNQSIPPEPYTEVLNSKGSLVLRASDGVQTIINSLSAAYQ